MAHTFVPKGNRSVQTQHATAADSDWGPPNFGQNTPTRDEDAKQGDTESLQKSTESK